jgi:hypothetical protein
MAPSDWPVWWVLIPPAMMLALMAVCMMSMRCMTRWRRDDRAGNSRATDPARTGLNVPARFPEGQAALEQLGTAEDKAEFDRFVAAHKRPIPPA